MQLCIWIFELVPAWQKAILKFWSKKQINVGWINIEKKKNYVSLLSNDEEKTTQRFKYTLYLPIVVKFPLRLGGVHKQQYLQLQRHSSPHSCQ